MSSFERLRYPEPESLSRTIAEAPRRQKAWLALSALGLAGLANGAIVSFNQAADDIYGKAASHSKQVYAVASQIAMVPSLAVMIGGIIGIIYSTPDHHPAQPVKAQPEPN